MMSVLTFNDDVFSAEQNKTVNSFIKILMDSSDKYDYVILTSRRCFCLFNGIVSKGFRFEQKQKFISSQAIDICGNELAGKKVLLCDDIMIHGQAVYSLYEKIKSYHPLQIDVFVMIRNIEKPDYFKYKTNTQYKVIVNLCDEEWRDFSNKIVKFIHHHSVLYISYVYGFDVKSNFFDEVLDKLPSIRKLEHEKNIFVHNYYLKEEYEPRYYLFDNLEKHWGLNSRIINYAAIRTYKNTKEEDSFWVVPYVELVEIKNSVLSRIFNRLSIIDKRFGRIGTPCDQYKALTAIFSIILFKYIGGEKYSVKFTEYIDKSYFDGFYSSVTEKIILEDIIKIINENEIQQIAEHSELSENKMISELKELVTKEAPIELEDLRKYFSTINLLEEEEFRLLFRRTEKENFETDYVSQGKKLNPIRTGIYYSLLSEIRDFKDKMFKYTLYFSDNGVVSFVVNEFSHNEEKYVGAFIKAGEQSYRMHADFARENFSSIYYLYDLLLYYNNLDTRKQITQSVIDRMNDKYRDVLDVEKFEFFFQKHFYNLFNLPNYFFATATEDMQIDKNKELEVSGYIRQLLNEFK